MAPCTADAQQHLVGETYRALRPLTLRATDVLHSELVTQVSKGTVFQIEELSADSLRAKVRAGSHNGWLSLSTKDGRLNSLHVPVAKLKACIQSGSWYSLLAPLPMRAEDAIASSILKLLDPSEQIQVLEAEQWATTRRVCIETKRGERGWISVAKGTGELLIEAITDAVEGDADQQLMFLTAARSGDADTVRHLCREASSLDLNCTDVHYKTGLMFAAGHSHVDVVKILLSQPSLHVNAVDESEKTALHYAVHPTQRGKGGADQEAIVSSLLQAAAELEARDYNGCTPLFLVISRRSTSLVKLLLEANASTCARDLHGYTPLDYARALGDAELLEMLQAAGGIPGAGSASIDGDQTLEKKEWLRRESLVGRRRSLVLQDVSRRLGSRGEQVQASAREAKLYATVRRSSANSEDEMAPILLQPAATEVSEEEAEQQRAALALSDVLDRTSAASPLCEVEATLAAAEAAEVDEDLLRRGRSRVLEIRVCSQALESLQLAMEMRSVEKLREAISVARQAAVPESDLNRARAVLHDEEPKHEAREGLTIACSSGSVQAMKEAITAAKAAQLPADELEEFEAMLIGAVSREEAELALKEALTDIDVETLRFTIHKARENAADPGLIAAAEQALMVEEPRHACRARMLEAVEKRDASTLRDALAEAESLGLNEQDCALARECVSNLELQEKRMTHLRELVQSAADIDKNDLFRLKDREDELVKGISAAKSAGVKEAKLREAELARRKVHNAVEDLKGSIRVFCRIRPLSSKEKGEGETEVMTVVDSMTLEVSAVQFSFDAVFAPGSQEEIFEDCKDLVRSALDGYNVTIFAYGQTGAGKTFTMYGNPEMEGIAPRTIRELFKNIDAAKDRYSYTVTGSMMEIYRSEIVDLLVDRRKSMRRSTGATRRSVMPEAQGVTHGLNVHVQSGHVTIEDLIEEQCFDHSDLSSLLDRGMMHRHVAATAMNSESSRSHLIFMIKIISINLETEEKVTGKILLCDLAGSERLKKSEVRGEMQKEAIEINRSLTALGDVIEALTKKSKQVPYRNHKLTQVMQDSLGGSAKTLMFVNCSPAGCNEDESQNALKYATRAKKITNEIKKKRASLMPMERASLMPMERGSIL